MAIEDTSERIESVLDEDDLTKIQDFAILVSIKLEVLGPFERMTTGLAFAWQYMRMRSKSDCDFQFLPSSLNCSNGTRWLPHSLFLMPGG